MAYGYKRKRRYRSKRRPSRFRRRRSTFSRPVTRYASSRAARIAHRTRVFGRVGAGGSVPSMRSVFREVGRGLKRGADAAWDYAGPSVKHHAARLVGHAANAVAAHAATVAHRALTGRPPNAPPPALPPTHPEVVEL